MKRRTWDEFRASGLLWWVNRALHLFGWAIVVEMEDGEAIDAYPAKVEFRGFEQQDETEGFQKLTNHLAEEAPRLVEDVKF